MAMASNSSSGNPRASAADYSKLFERAAPSPPRPMKRGEILIELSSFGKMGEALLKLMNIPEKLHCLDDGRFTSDSKKPAFLVTHPQFVADLDKSQFAEYSIAIGSRGSNVFCTLIDRKRNILVSTSIKNMYVSEGSWEHFHALLESAIDGAEKLTSEQRKEGVLVMRVS